MIQILGLRDYTNASGKVSKKHARLSEAFLAPSVSTLFKEIEKYLADIPEAERYNVYYTVCDCQDPSKKMRVFESQKVLPFDLDHIDVEQIEKYQEIFFRETGADRSKTATIFSGNGLQWIIEIPEDFRDEEFFNKNRIYYKAIASRIDKAVKAQGLPGEMDSSVWSSARLMRFPGTINLKPHGRREARFVERNLEPQDFSLIKASRIPIVEEASQVTVEEIRKYPVDTRAVLTECRFINWAHDNPEKVDEPLWYAALSIVGRLERGVELAHKLSQGHPKYTHAETEEKLNQAMESSGPRTCADINARWGKCQGCPHFQKVKSPILIRGEEFIATESQGFYSIVETKQGEKFVPNYDDLLKFFIKQTNYKVVSQTGIVYVYKENRYEVLPPLEIFGFAEEHFDPKPKSAYREEFKTKVLSNRQVDVSFFDAPGKLNFKNGVLDTITDEFLPHSPELGFRYVLPYDYDPNATSPQFEQFLKDVTLDDPELQILLKQFGGYALSGDDCWAQKALILTGEGRNGKSVFLQVLGAVAGKNNTGYLNLAQLKNDNNRQLLEGRLFNLSEETPDYAMQESSLFKQLVTGGEITVKQMYHQPYIIKNRCKLLFACNDIPVSKDKSAGLTRRLLIIPFKKEFQDSNVDYKIFDKLATELPGIFNAFRNAYKPLASEQVGFKPPESMREVMEEFKKDNDIVYDYAHCGRIKFHKIGTTTHRVLMSKIYEDFTLFYEVDQHQRTGLPTFRAFCKRFKRAVPGFDNRVRYDMSKEYRNKLVMFDAELEQLE